MLAFPFALLDARGTYVVTGKRANTVQASHRASLEARLAFDSSMTHFHTRMTTHEFFATPRRADDVLGAIAELFCALLVTLTALGAAHVATLERVSTRFEAFC